MVIAVSGKLVCFDLISGASVIFLLMAGSLECLVYRYFTLLLCVGEIVALVGSIVALMGLRFDIVLYVLNLGMST